MKIVFFHGSNDYWQYYLENTKVSYDVDLVFGRQIFTKSRILRFFSKIHLSNRINKIVSLPLKHLWCSKLIPFNYTYNKPITFIIYTSYIASLPFSVSYFFKYLHKHFNSRITIMFGNTVDSEDKYFDCKLVCHMADLVCSYNTEDRGKYNIMIHPTLFFDVNTTILPLSERSIDVFFIGQEKGRGQEINKTYKILSQYGLNCEFYIVGPVVSDKITGIHYVETMIPYSFVVDKLKDTRCILNLLWEGSQGVTLRDMEAYNNGCFILKNFVDDTLYGVLHEEQILLTKNISKDMAFMIKSAKASFHKKETQNSLDLFYHWVIDECWNKIS